MHYASIQVIRRIFIALMIFASFNALQPVTASAGDSQGQPKRNGCNAIGGPVEKASPLAYTDRGDRCEGLFRQKVAASAQLALIGVHAHSPKFKPGSGKTLTVVPVGAGHASAIAIRVLSSRPRLYYRMDAKLASATRFVWKREILDNSRVTLGPREIKALLCEESCDKKVPKVFPASITEGRAPPSGGVTLWFRAAIDLRKLFITLQRRPNGKTALKNTDVLEGRLLPAGAAKDVFVTLRSGTYDLRALAVPVGASAMDQVRARIVIP
jgi:hypothetical protein